MITYIIFFYFKIYLPGSDIYICHSIQYDMLYKQNKKNMRKTENNIRKTCLYERTYVNKFITHTKPKQAAVHNLLLPQ